MNKTKRRVGIYLRVSTSGQTTENQRRDLRAWVSRSGHELAAVFEDAGISVSRPVFKPTLQGPQETILSPTNSVFRPHSANKYSKTDYSSRGGRGRI